MSENLRVPERVRSWASTAEEVDERVRRAGRLAGSRLRAVRYFDLDSNRWSVAPERSGPREVVDEKEWLKPNWALPEFDSVDHGLELETHSGRIFSVTWDSPGETEGLGIDELPLVGSALATDADIGIWDVSHRSRWKDLIDQKIVAVKPHYHPWDWSGKVGFWCSRISLRFPAIDVVLLLAGAGPDGTLKSSGECVAVLFGPTALPQWESELD